MADIQRNVLINFQTNTTDLDAALTDLERLGAVDKKAAASFKQTNTEIQKQGKSLQDNNKDLAAQQKSVAGLKKALLDLYKVNDKETQLGIQDALIEAGVSANELEKGAEGFGFAAAEDAEN